MIDLINHAQSVNVSLSVEDLQNLIQQTVEETISALCESGKKDVVWLSADQVCEKLGITRTTLWRWSREGYISGTKFGKRIRFAESDVNRVAIAEKGGVVA